MRKRLKVLTAGCKANFADSASVIRSAAAAGFDVVSPSESADVIVINTCTVTHRADRDSRSMARRSRRENPSATIILAGCFAQVSPQSRENLPEVDHWTGATGRGSGEDGSETIDRILREIGGRGRNEPVRLSEYAANLLLGHRRTFLKIQDGCDFSCSYCVVPVARGGNRSVPEEEVIAKAIEAEADGARELVLTGIHIGLYGADRGKRDALPGLVLRLLQATSRSRIRLSSVEPGEISPHLVEVVSGNQRVSPHLHVPLQSGCDRTLSRMRRPYRAAEYLAVVTRAASRIPGLALGADVLVGLPGETTEDFEETERFLRDSPVTYLHVFPYSARPGTESAGWRDDIDGKEKKRRVARLLALDSRMRDRFLRRQVGSTLDVLAESSLPDGSGLSGRSGNYAEVVFPGNPEEIGGIHRVSVTTVRNGRLVGTRS